MTVDQLLAHLRDLSENGADFERLLETAVQELSRMDPRFHWTGIYELFSDNVLRLGPYVGSPTDHVFIGVGNGVCGTAVAEKRNLNIPDVREISNDQAAVFLADGEEPLREFWHSKFPEDRERIRATFKAAALESVRGGLVVTPAPVMLGERLIQPRAHPLRTSGRVLGAVCFSD